MEKIYAQIRRAAIDLWRGEGLLGEKVTVKARPLSVEEAIGNPEDDDFPLQKGKEKLMQAEFRGAKGQAFTDRYGDFEGTFEEIFNMGHENNYRRAILVAALNAGLRYMGRVTDTVHCRDQEPVECAMSLSDYVKKQYGDVKVLQVGFQPRMLEVLSKRYRMRILDLDPDNIGMVKFDVTVEGPEATEEAVKWADLLLVTGTTLVNATIETFLGNGRVLFYGTTIAGAAYLMGWNRFCAKSS
ncbi:MAG: hypothetical protein JW882_16860 [Deltaproteobacteria bacterium]|nr:hypothetical protein [Deltaproteobacteria bacterium]